MRVNLEVAGILIGILMVGILAYIVLGWVWCLISVIVCYSLVMWKGGTNV